MTVYFVIALLIQFSLIYFIRKNRDDLKAMSLSFTSVMTLSLAVLVWPYFATQFTDIMVISIRSFRYAGGAIALNIDPAIFEKFEIPGAIGPAYRVFLYYLHIAGPLTASLFAVSFSRSVSEWIHFRGHKKIHVFSELNSKTASIAESIAAIDDTQMLVFCNVPETSKQDLNVRAKAVHAILLNKSENDIIIEKNKEYEFYEIGNDVHDILIRVTKLCEDLISNKRYSKERVIVRFSGSDEDIDLIRNINSSYSDKVRLRPINETDSEAVSMLRNYSSVLSTSGHHDVVIVGGGDLGMSILKLVLCVMYQPDSSFTVHYISGRARSEASHFKLSSPEVLNLPIDSYFGGDADGKNYDIRFCETDIYGSGLFNALENVDSPDLVCVLGGTDSQNYRLAGSIKRFYASRHDDLSYPEIACCIRDKSINDILEEESGIFLFGIEKSKYDYSVLVGSDIENVARRVHLAYLSSAAPEALDYGEDLQEKLLSDTGFYNYSSFQSSISNALTLEYRRAYILSTRPESDSTPDDEYVSNWLDVPENVRALGDSEHLRWNAYQRVQGWRTATAEQTVRIAENSSGARIKSDELLLHPALVSVEELPAVEQQTDSIRHSVDPKSPLSRFVDLDRDIMLKMPEILGRTRQCIKRNR